MRYSRPFVSDFVIGNDGVAVIFFVKFEIFAVKVIFSKRNTLFCLIVSDMLEFRKHSLAEDSGSYHFEIIRTQIFFKFYVRTVL